MPNWTSYAYCEKCDRPLRTHEFRSKTTGSGDGKQTSHFCKLCGKRGRNPNGSFFGFLVGDLAAWFAIFLGGGLSVYYYQDRQANGIETTGLHMVLVGFMVLVLPAMMFAVGRWQKSKCKPIYDRWVMQHGTDPDKWPAPVKPE